MKGYLTNLSIGNYGRFANGTYQVAAVIGIARRNGLTPAFPEWQNHWARDAFGSKEDADIYKHLMNPLPSIPNGVTFQDRAVEWGYHEIHLPDGNWNLSGHFQSTKYFAHCLDEVRWQLTFKDEPAQNDYVAVHVRLGDYDNAYHPRLGMKYYAPAMAHFPDEKFMIFSDDIEAAMMMFLPTRGYEVEFARGDYLEDFKLMKRCKHFIVGNSSYSAMAAVLADHPAKRVVAPRPWFGEKYANINGEDIYNADWHVVNWQQAKAA